MEHKEAEEFFRKQINHLDGLPPDTNWQKERSWYRLEEKLKPVSRHKAVPFGYATIAASVIVLLGIGWLIVNYINTKEKQITHLQQKLEDVKELKSKPAMSVDSSRTKHDKLAASTLQQTSRKQRTTIAASKSYKKNSDAPVENTIAADFITDSTHTSEPVLSLEEATPKIVIPVPEDQVPHVTSVQERIRGQVKKKPYNAKARQIIFVFPNDQEEYLARQPAEPSPNADRKLRLNYIIINNNRENATTEAQQNTGADTYLRINPERIK